MSKALKHLLHVEQINLLLLGPDEGIVAKTVEIYCHKRQQIMTLTIYCSAIKLKHPFTSKLCWVDVFFLALLTNHAFALGYMQMFLEVHESEMHW